MIQAGKQNVKSVPVHQPNLLITPIAKAYKSSGPCSRKDWEEQLRRAANFEQMMWDDSAHNHSQVGDIFISWHYQKGVTFHRIEAIYPPSQRLPSWSNNVGQGDRQVIYISSEFARMNWNEWSDIGGHQRCMGTSAIKTSSHAILTALQKIISPRSPPRRFRFRPPVVGN